MFKKGNKVGQGVVHDALSRDRTSEAMKDYWLEHPERHVRQSKLIREWWQRKRAKGGPLLPEEAKEKERG